MLPTDITFRFGGETLAGTLAPGAGDAVALLVSGSGPIDRNSNMKRLSIGVMEQVAAYLSGEGVASFRYDKRGVAPRPTKLQEPLPPSTEAMP